MEYRVELSSRAQRDIEDVFAYIHADAPLNAVKWRRGLEQKLQLLHRMPTVFSKAPENQDTRSEVRQLLFGRYRILYTVEADFVFVLTIRHGARRFMRSEDLDSIE